VRPDGRQPELERVGALITGSAGLVTLIGSGGIGKTHLALEVVHRVHETTRFPVHWTRLARLERGAAADGVRAAGLGGRAEQWLLRNPMSAVLRHEIGAVRASGRTVVAITPGSEDMRGLGWNFMNRRPRRAAFDSARRHEPAAVRRALEPATAAPDSPGRCRERPEAQ
jgi:hypothetical protein